MGFLAHPSPKFQQINVFKRQSFKESVTLEHRMTGSREVLKPRAEGRLGAHMASTVAPDVLAEASQREKKRRDTGGKMGEKKS